MINAVYSSMIAATTIKELKRLVQRDQIIRDGILSARNVAEVYNIFKKMAGRFSAAFLRNIKSDELVWSRRRLPLDNEHLTNVASGDKAVFSELYDLTQTVVYGLTLSYMRAAHDAQDITQDTLSASGNPPGSIVRPVRQSRGF